MGVREGSIGRGSGSKTSQKTGPQLKDSSDRLGEPGIELGTPGFKTTDLSITPRQLTLWLFLGSWLGLCFFMA